jgi:LysM repeat protein
VCFPAGHLFNPEGMKKQLLLLVCLLCPAFFLAAQDSLWVQQEGHVLYIPHRVSRGETLFLLAARYGAPAAQAADLNGLDFQDGLAKGSVFKIPVGKFNYIRINSVVDSRPIYFKVPPGTSLRDVSRMVQVSQSAVQRWNALAGPDIEAGSVLQVGWVKYDASKVPFADDLPTTDAPPDDADEKLPPVVVEDSSRIPQDSLAGPADSPFGRLFHERNEGRQLVSESGAAVFYVLKASVDETTFYAFHDTAPRGTILSIQNPANGKVVYAKVVGSLPKISEYHNALIGLSSNAIAALQAKDKRMFCNIKW